MKKTLFFMMMLAMISALGLVACGDDDPADGEEGGACLADNSCNEGLVCVADTMTCEKPEDTGSTDGDTEDGDTEDGDTEDGDTTDGDECLDDDCPGIQLCDEEGACSADATLVCLDGKFNQDCAGTFELSTEAYGECATVPCETDDDCADLGACDNPDAGSTDAWVCEDNEGEMNCKRDI